MGILQANWDDLLDNIQQQERFKDSLTSAFTPSYLSRESYSGTFVGDTKAIVCCLGKSHCCNCDDYAKTEKSVRYPCSHMYRLAYEFGLVDINGRLKRIDEPRSYSILEIEVLFKEVVYRVEKFIPDEGQLHLISGDLYYTLSRCVKDNPCIPFRIKAAEAKDYILSGLFEQCYLSSIGILYDYGFIYDVVKKMDENGYTWPNTLSRTKRGSVTAKAKKDWCLTHPDDAISIAYPDGNSEYVMVRPSYKIIPIWDYLLQYWERKFNDEETHEKFRRYTIRHPVGAIVTDYKKGSYEFPPDIITDELNKYGHNRCITKKTGVGTGHLYRNRSVSFSVPIPTRGDFETLFSLLIPIASFYHESRRKSDVSAFMQVVRLLVQLDKFMDSAADNSIAMLAIARSEISKQIKNEDDIKSDFLNCRVILQDGKEIIGYENIRDRGFSVDQIKAVEFPSADL